MKLQMVLACITAVFLTFSTAVQAQSHIVEAYPPDISRRLEALDRRHKNYGLADLPRGVASAIKLWDPGKPIRVCFFHGAPGIRKSVRDIALRWKKIDGVAVPLDFGSRRNPRKCSEREISHIRIAFCTPASKRSFCADGENAGQWSLVGKDSANFQALTRPNEPSMNLEGVDSRNLSPTQIRRIVLHEFGHALGFEHEHQNPFAKCNGELKWPVIRKAFRAPPYNWGDQRIDYGFKDLFRNGTIAKRENLIVEKDQKTVMSYELDPKFFWTGRRSSCYRRAHFNISDIDAKLLRQMYPASPRAQVTLFKSRRSRILSAVRSVVGDSGIARAAADLDYYVDLAEPANK